MVESLAVRLNEGERKDFASQLPRELQDIALSVMASDENMKKKLIEQFMETQDIDRPHAEKQTHASWQALKDAVTSGEKQPYPRPTAKRRSRISSLGTLRGSHRN